MKTNIQVEAETRNKLSRWKYKLKCVDYDKVIVKLFKLVSTLKLEKELEDLKC